MSSDSVVGSTVLLSPADDPDLDFEDEVPVVVSAVVDVAAAEPAAATPTAAARRARRRAAARLRAALLDADDFELRLRDELDPPFADEPCVVVPAEDVPVVVAARRWAAVDPLDLPGEVVVFDS